MSRAALALLVVTAACPAAPPPPPGPPQPPALDRVGPLTMQDVVVVSGTLGALDDVALVNGTQAAGTGDLRFEALVPLAVGVNELRVVARAATGAESAPVDALIERLETLPFALDAPPAFASDDTIELRGIRARGVQVTVDGAVAAGADDPSVLWRQTVPLVAGLNSFTVTGELPAEPASRLTLNATITGDRGAPVLSLLAPAEGALVGGGVAVEAAADDDVRVTSVLACVGADDTCNVATAQPLALAGPSRYGGALDIADDPALVDGARHDLQVFAFDAAGNVTAARRALIVMRGPVAVDVGLDDVVAVALAERPAPVRALAAADSDGRVVLGVDGGGPLLDLTLTPLAGAGGSAPRVVVDGAGGVHALWLEDSDRATSLPGAPGLLYRSPAGAVEVVARGDAGGAVAGAALALVDDAGEALPCAAYVQDGVVRFRQRSSSAWGGAATLSDTLTADAGGAVGGDVALVVVTAQPGGPLAAVAWVERSARDGSADDADVVAATVDNFSGLTSGVGLVSGAAGAAGNASAPVLVVRAPDERVHASWIDGGAVAVLQQAVDPLALTGAGAGGLPRGTLVANEGVARLAVTRAPGSGELFAWSGGGGTRFWHAALNAPVDVPTSLSGPVSALDVAVDGALVQLLWAELGGARFFVPVAP